MSYLDNAYDIIKRRISDSKGYQDYVYYITSDKNIGKKLEESTSYEKDGKVVSFTSELIENIDFINDFSNVYGLDEDFCRIAIKTFDNDSIMNKIINTKFTETLYGNPSKEDLSNVDALFTILESFFGLDTIIKSVTYKRVLNDRFLTVLKTDDKSLEYDFISLIEKIYNETVNLKSYEEVKMVINNYKDELKVFAMPGLITQLNEVSLDDNGSFKRTNILRDRLVDLIGTDINKKM